VDCNGLEVLDRDQCMGLLAGVNLGRVALHTRALPVVLPVNFALAGDRIVFPTDRGTRLAAGTNEAVVAFEADDIDAASHDRLERGGDRRGHRDHRR